MPNDDRNFKLVKTRPTRIEATLVDGSKVEGYLHLTTDHRLSDQLNINSNESPFLALTEAKILLPGGMWSHYDFFTFNRNMIVCCFPKD